MADRTSVKTDLREWFVSCMLRKTTEHTGRELDRIEEIAITYEIGIHEIGSQEQWDSIRAANDEYLHIKERQFIDSAQTESPASQSTAV